MQLLGDDDVCHRDEHRGVSRRFDVDMFVSHRGAGVRPARVDAHHADPLLTSVLQVFEGACAEAAVAWRPAPEQHELGVGVVYRVSPGGPGGSCVLAIRVAEREHLGFAGDVAPWLGAAAEHVEQTCNRVAVVQQRRGAPAGCVEDRRRAVFLADAQHLAGHFVERFVPRNTLELARSSRAGAAHRILEPVGVVYPLLGREPACAGVQRLHLRFPSTGLRADLDDLAVTNVCVDHASPATPGGARAGDDPLPGSFRASRTLVDGRCGHVVLAVLRVAPVRQGITLTRQHRMRQPRPRCGSLFRRPPVNPWSWSAAVKSTHPRLA